ncbi:MAG: ABC transporter ATP-binding protein [Verrucomicrobiota bacterium JB022]|nr:ABC transporter ATP-binding protein [Verrucomicrobiota bacterium JB022]
MPKATPEFSIVAEGLSKTYGRAKVLHQLSFSVRPGEVVGFLGPNGAGKSTTMRILTGLIRADSGEAFVDGISVAREPQKVQERLGYMPENNPLPEDLRVKDYLRFRGRLKGLHGKKLRTQVSQSLEWCDLHRKHSRRLIGQLSKGLRQRVGIAEAVLANPAVTILDEPTIGLDPHQILLIRRLIEQLRGKTTVILSSHILAEVEVSCDRVLIINQGHLVAAGTLEELRHEFVQGEAFELVFKGTPEDLTAVLAEHFPTMQVTQHEPLEGDWHEAHLSAGEQGTPAEEVLRRLQEHPNITVREWRERRARLEDIFLAATRRSWDLENANPHTHADA